MEGNRKEGQESEKRRINRLKEREGKRRRERESESGERAVSLQVDTS